MSSPSAGTKFALIVHIKYFEYSDNKKKSRWTRHKQEN